MARPLSIRPEAEAEITEAYDWYDERKPGIGAEFLNEARKGLSAIVRNGVRRRILDRFPCSILYLAEPDEIVVLACFHGRRDPKRWHSRT